MVPSLALIFKNIYLYNGKDFNFNEKVSKNKKFLNAYATFYFF